MCGISGYIGENNNSIKTVFNVLKKLEYRGYDSSGIATIFNKKILIKKSIGKLVNLKKIILKHQIESNISIGHIRWATHGKPSRNNAHPHTDVTKNIAIVHNGVIENYIELKKKYCISDKEIVSDTDTEIVVHIIKKNYKNDLFSAVRNVLCEVKGSYAFALICKNEPDKIICAVNESPLVIGVGDKENFIASDVSAVLKYTKKIIFLENGDIAEIKKNNIMIRDIKNNIKDIQIKTIKDENYSYIGKNKYKHFMLKEIFEQPYVIKNILKNIICLNKNKNYENEFKFFKNIIKNISYIYIIGCGSSYHSGLIAKFLFENFVNIRTEVDIASEFRYRNPILNENTLVIVISQSGETADTLAALRFAKNKKCKTFAICNVANSSLSREADKTIFTKCGQEIGVASTKAFIGQLVILYLLVFELSNKKGIINNHEFKKIMLELLDVPKKIFKILKNTKSIINIAEKIKGKKNFLYLGRNLNYPIALEGALKLKEISYIHAEGYAAGEMKHGPIALVDKSMIVVFIVIKKSKVYKKIISNMEEIKARNGTIVLITNEKNREIKDKSDYVIYIPRINDYLSPIISIVPLQLLAYYIGVFKKCDIDHPRNLAKSVTVE
jgi:glucosamine--fructose-6-phosphate aminotransferase (isomerizing)